MAKGIYYGVNGQPRKVKKLYYGVNGQPRKVKKAYIGVKGTPRIIYSAGIQRISNVPPLSVARGNPCGATNPNFAIFAGGSLNWGNIWSGMDNVDAYDSRLAKVAVANLTKSADGFAGATLGNWALFEAGLHLIDWRDGNPTSESISEAYDLNLTKTSLIPYRQRSYDMIGISMPNFAIFAGGMWRNGDSGVEIASVHTRDLSLVTKNVGVIGIGGGDRITFGCKFNNLACFYCTNNIIATYDSTLVQVKINSPSTGFYGKGVSTNEYMITTRNYTPNTSTAIDKNWVKHDIAPLPYIADSSISNEDTAMFLSRYWANNSNEMINATQYYDNNLTLNVAESLPTNYAKRGVVRFKDYFMFAGGTLDSVTLFNTVDAYEF